MALRGGRHERESRRGTDVPGNTSILASQRTTVPCAASAPGSTPSETEEWGNQRWYQGGGRIGEKAFRDIVVYPPTRGLVTQGDAFEPVKIGLLVDIELGQLLADWIDATILAIEDALNEGVYDRPVQLVIADARGLPRENYLKVRQGYEWLVRPRLCGGARSHDLGQLTQHPATRQRAEGRMHRLDRSLALCVRVQLHRRQRGHPDRGRHVCPMDAAAGLQRGRHVLGTGFVGT